jgi:hypothetical protein
VGPIQVWIEYCSSDSGPSTVAIGTVHPDSGYGSVVVMQREHCFTSDTVARDLGQGKFVLAL